jgi:hypothetical protein
MAILPPVYRARRRDRGGRAGKRLRPELCAPRSGDEPMAVPMMTVGRQGGEPRPREEGHRGDQFGPDPPPELEPAEEAVEPAGGQLGGGRRARPPIPRDELPHVLGSQP